MSGQQNFKGATNGGVAARPFFGLSEGAIYWTGVALTAAALFIPKLLPCVDYPQHLALSDMVRRLQDPTAIEHETHSLHFFTYNVLFHGVVAKLARL
ncbi:MAG: hypothetical protein WCI05_05985, partial [Myxococcales bacterium]